MKSFGRTWKSALSAFVIFFWIGIPTQEPSVTGDIQGAFNHRADGSQLLGVVLVGMILVFFMRQALKVYLSKQTQE